MRVSKPTAKYTVFNIGKKSGGQRIISSPATALKILQRITKSGTGGGLSTKDECPRIYKPKGPNRSADRPADGKKRFFKASLAAFWKRATASSRRRCKEPAMLAKGQSKSKARDFSTCSAEKILKYLSTDRSGLLRCHCWLTTSVSILRSDSLIGRTSRGYPIIRTVLLPKLA
jgi:hypothetical protein